MTLEQIRESTTPKVVAENTLKSPLESMSTEDLRRLKKEIEAELSKRHKAKEEEKCSCWTCGHCFYNENAHTSYKWNRGDYKCMAWGRHGKIIPTKHKAPSWCPIKKGRNEK